MIDTTNKDPACPHCGERYGASAEIEHLTKIKEAAEKLRDYLRVEGLISADDYISRVDAASKALFTLLSPELTKGGVTRLDDEIVRLRSELGSTPCKRLMLQQQPYSECFPLHICDGCDCWRSRVSCSTTMPCSGCGQPQDITGHPNAVSVKCSHCVSSESEQESEPVVPLHNCAYCERTFFSPEGRDHHEELCATEKGDG